MATNFRTSVAPCVLVLCMCAAPLRARSGTTPNIKHIVMGRCFNYITLVNPGIRSDCEEIWRAFEEAVLRQASCDVAAEHYRHMFRAMPQTGACDRFLLWSKTRTLVQDYAAVVHHLWTLEDTLVGYMFNDLIWCGQHEHSDFNFGSCPEWSACVHHPVHSLWRQASKSFAEMACGNVTVLLNGSIDKAFNRNSMFGSVELDSLNPQRVHYVNIKVVANLDGPFIESCNGGSIADLIHILQTRGFRWTCSDHDRILTMLQCIHKPEHSACHTCTDSHPVNWQIMDKFWCAKTNLRVAGGPGAYPSCLRAVGGGHPESVASQSQGTQRRTTIHAHTHT